MHPLYLKADRTLEDVTFAAKQVLNTLGPGLLESIYRRCLAQELTLMGHTVKQEKPIEVHYKGISFEENLRADIIVDDCVILELKSVEGAIRPEFVAQLLSYLSLTDLPLGMILNFGATSERRYQRILRKGCGPDEMFLSPKEDFKR